MNIKQTINEIKPMLTAFPGWKVSECMMLDFRTGTAGPEMAMVYRDGFQEARARATKAGKNRKDFTLGWREECYTAVRQLSSLLEKAGLTTIPDGTSLYVKV